VALPAREYRAAGGCAQFDRRSSCAMPSVIGAHHRSRQRRRKRAPTRLSFPDMCQWPA